ncbi:hypothetical protein [uncultured Treponema sp.]|uniref:hypothetical protein n=1 Tax=uncultured Treponema sp. TaxID=162155 RepID=UPI0025CED18C|nr:hypothetical protein [uncultured Treponema sp.]
MKKFLKALAVLAAVAALGFGFASCSDSDDDDGGSGSGALAAFTYTKDYGRDTIYFYSDNTWECIETKPDFNYTGTDYKGTYAITSGDFTNGTLDFTVVEHSGIERGWEKVSLEIKDGVFYLYVPDSGAVDVNDPSDDKYVKQ